MKVVWCILGENKKHYLKVFSFFKEKEKKEEKWNGTKPQWPHQIAVKNDSAAHTAPLFPWVVCGSSGWFVMDAKPIGNVWKKFSYSSSWELIKAPEHKFAPNIFKERKLCSWGRNLVICAFKRHLADTSYQSGKAIPSVNPSILKSFFGYVFIEYGIFLTILFTIGGALWCLKVLHSSSTLTKTLPCCKDSSFFLCMWQLCP